jgi:dihydroorotase
MTTRRDFLARVSAAAGALAAASAPVRAAVGDGSQVSAASTLSTLRSSAPPYDLLITGGRVIDPARGPAVMADVAIKDGLIDLVAPNIPRAQALATYDASGKIVTPGLIDCHVHVFDGVATSSIDADQVGLKTGVTTMVDAGSAGATSFPGFRKRFIETAQVDVYALLNISRIGLIVNNETYVDPALIDARAATSIINANKDRILGIKVRINGRASDLPRDIEVLKIGREASDATGVPILMHWSNEPELLALLKKGDTLIHPFNPPSANSSNLVGGTGDRVLQQILDLKARGIFTDFAHGNHLDWTVAETAAKAGWFPDTLSTDLHRGHVAPNGVVHDLVTTMSKFMHLGLTIEQAVEKVTAAPLPAENRIARGGQRRERVGARGAAGELRVLRLAEGEPNGDAEDHSRRRRTAWEADGDHRGLATAAVGCPPAHPPWSPGSTTSLRFAACRYGDFAMNSVEA